MNVLGGKQQQANDKFNSSTITSITTPTPTDDNNNNNTDTTMSSIFDDIDEDHFLVRRHLQRCSFNDGESLVRDRPRFSGASLLLQNPRLSSVAKKPIKFPPPKKAEDECVPSEDHSSEQTNELLDRSQSSSGALVSKALDNSKKEEEEELEEEALVDSISNLEAEFSKLSLQMTSSLQRAVDDDDDNNEDDAKDNDDNDKNDELDSCHVSTPDSLEELELKQIHETRKTQLEEGEFKMEHRNDADSAVKPQSSKRMSKIISYDEALNIPQTDDDKERMTSSSRRKERPSNLLIHSPVRPTSARIRPRKSMIFESAGGDSFLGSMQSLNSTLRSPTTPGADDSSFLTSEEDKQEFLRRTQSFRSSRSAAAGSRRATLGAELVSHIQQNAKTLYSTFEYLSPKDQRVLAVMLAKREQEREEERMKQEMKMRWESEKMIKDKSRLSFHQTLNESSPVILGCGHKTSQECIGESCQAYKSLTLEERKQHENRMKLQQALERKKRVEQRLEELKRKKELQTKELLEKQQKELERAMNIKKERNEQIKQKMLKQNESTKQKLEQLKTKKPSEKELTNIEESMKATLSAAEMKAKKMKEEEASKIGKKLQTKIEKAHQVQKSMEEELKTWQEQALTYRQQQDKQAEALQAIQLAQRKESLARAREAKEKAQRENLKRILEREKEWRESVEATIQTKDEKRKLLNQEKESLLQKSRAQAQLTRRLREELKLTQSLTDLDKLSKYVDLQRKILN